MCTRHIHNAAKEGEGNTTKREGRFILGAVALFPRREERGEGGEKAKKTEERTEKEDRRTLVIAGGETDGERLHCVSNSFVSSSLFAASRETLRQHRAPGKQEKKNHLRGLLVWAPVPTIMTAATNSAVYGTFTNFMAIMGKEAWGCNQ